MNKYLLAFFSMLLVAVCIFANNLANSDLRLLVSENSTFVLVRTGAAIMLLAYSLIPYLRHRLVKAVVRNLGILLIALGGMSILSPSLLGMLDTYIMPLDTFIALEAGILSVLGGTKITGINNSSNKIWFISPQQPAKQRLPLDYA